MRSRAYWLGLAILTSAVMLIYEWNAMPEISHSLFFGQTLIPLESSRLTSAGLKTKLKSLGLTFPPGSRVSHMEGLGYSSFGHDIMGPPTIKMKNTWRNHRKLLESDIVEPGLLGFHPSLPSTVQCYDFTFQIAGRAFGLTDYGIGSLDGERHVAGTSIYLGAPSREMYYHDRAFRILPRQMTIYYRYRAWPALLALTLIPYTSVFFLRRPMGRAVASLSLKRTRRD